MKYIYIYIYIFTSICYILFYIFHLFCVLKHNKSLFYVFEKQKVVILGAEKAPAGTCTRSSAFNGVFVSSRHKNQDFVFSKYKKRYFCCGKSPCGHVATNSVFLKHRESLESSFSGAEITQWVGPQTQDPKVPGSIPGSCRSLFGHFFVMLG